MAKFENSMFMTDLSGRMGDVVFTKGIYGPIVKQYKHPKNRKTPAQMRQRLAMCYVKGLWNSLTLKQYDSWNQGANRFQIKPKGKIGFLNAYMLFMKINLSLNSIGCEPKLDCPDTLYKPFGLDFVDVDIVLSPKGEDILLTFVPNLGKDECLVISATEPCRRSRKPSKSSYRQIGVIDSKWNPGKKPVSIMSFYLNKYSVQLMEGQVAGFRFEIAEKNAGLRSGDWEIVKGVQVRR